jgi:hypothetical protein
MRDRLKLFIAIYIGFLAAALSIGSDVERDLKASANRADLRVAVMEIKGQSNVITGMRKIRNAQRARADGLQGAMHLLTIAVAVASPALIAVGAGAWLLLSASLITAIISGWMTFVVLVGS